MAKTLFLDPRTRVVAAIADGMSRRPNAVRLSVGTASAIRGFQRGRLQAMSLPNQVAATPGHDA